MKNILVIGATGQIGSELTMELRNRYGNENVVAGYIPGAEPKGELKESGPAAVVDVTNAEMIESVVKEYNIDTIYNLAALLSVVAESKPKLAWKIGIDGLWDVRCLHRVLSARSEQIRHTRKRRRTPFSVHVRCMAFPK